VKVLITGSKGFIGKNLVNYLRSEGCQVVEFEGDITKRADIKQSFTNHIDAVVHLSAYGNDSSHDQKTDSGIAQTLHTNIIGTTQLIEKFIHSEAKTFIFAGSSSEYGTQKEPMSTESTLDGKTPYALSKIAISNLLKGLDVPSKRFKVLRLFSVYGLYEKPNRLIPTAFRCSLTGETMPIADGVHDFVHVSDVCKSVLKLLDEPRTTPTISHVASGIQYSNQEVLETIEQITGNKINTYPRNNIRPADTNFSWVSDKKSILIQPTYSLKDGLTEVWKHRHL
jgi:nucleoside-diphosphate-sugar epimerase